MKNTITQNRIKSYLESTRYPCASSAEQMAVDALNYYDFYASKKLTYNWMFAVLDLVDLGVIVYDDRAESYKAYALKGWSD